MTGRRAKSNVVVALTAAQRALITGEPGLARRAVVAVVREYGQVLPENEALEAAEEGVARGAQTFDPARGKEFGWWGFWRACQAILDAAGVERRHRAVVGLLRAAFLRRRALEGRVEEPEAASFEDVEARLATAPERLLKLAEWWVDELVEDMAAGGEEWLLAREEAALAARALRQVFGELFPWQRRLLSLRFEDAKTVEKAAKRLETPVRTIERRWRALMKTLRSRLAALGVRSMPPWFQGEGTAILAEGRDERDLVDEGEER